MFVSFGHFDPCAPVFISYLGEASMEKAPMLLEKYCKAELLVATAKRSPGTILQDVHVF